jgi:tetratricopeptide (TPR) repeat protein
MRGEVCEAGRSSKQRREILDLRDACLARRRGQLQALATLLAEGPDVGALDRAVAAAAGLPPVAYCADIEALTARVRPPEDPALRARVDALQPRVDRLESLYVTGKYREGLAFAAPLLAETAAVPYPPLDAQVLFWTGRLHEANGDFEAAREKLRAAALAAAEGGDDVLVAHTWARLLYVVAERQQRLDEAALIHSLGAVAVTRAHDERIRAVWLNAEGLLLWHSGKAAEAKATHERALALREKVLGPEHPDVAGSVNNLGLVLQDLDDFPAAMRAHERALALREKVLGPDHPDVGQSLNNLGIIYGEVGDYARAVTVQERALALKERVLGPDHSDTAQTLDNLAEALFRTGDLARAIAVEERALAIDEKKLGSEHANFAWGLLNLSHMLVEKGDLPRALALCERATAIFERVRRPTDPYLSVAFSTRGSMLHEAGDDAQARQSYERALAIAEKTPGPQSMDYALARAGLGRAQVGLGQLDLALASFETALSLMERRLGPKHPNLAEPLLGLGEVALARRRPQDAEPPLERAGAGRRSEQAQGAAHARRGRVAGREGSSASALPRPGGPRRLRAGRQPRVDRQDGPMAIQALNAVSQALPHEERARPVRQVQRRVPGTSDTPSAARAGRRLDGAPRALDEGATVLDKHLERFTGGSDEETESTRAGRRDRDRFAHRAAGGRSSRAVQVGVHLPHQPVRAKHVDQRRQGLRWRWPARHLDRHRAADVHLAAFHHRVGRGPHHLLRRLLHRHGGHHGEWDQHSHLRDQLLGFARLHQRRHHGQRVLLALTRPAARFFDASARGGVRNTAPRTRKAPRDGVGTPLAFASRSASCSRARR